ncbi:hypothetical protein [Prauserella flavalba]|uniref:MFS transporter n=1 Tax=Prauserella flavalba TaxID=1477506 RepID=A0A318M6W0_9PSEU|nr:hypothetical protein [Prauserella flavalba]PXY30516.1 hypothetical protein BA062_18305 [Prauserella flavalba]
MLTFREPRARATAAPSDLVTLLRRPRVARWAFVPLPLMWLGAGGSFMLLTPMLIDAGWSLSRLGLVNTVLGNVAAIAGGLAAGVALTRISRRTALLVLSFAQVVVVASLFPLASGNAPLPGTATLVCLLHACYAAAVTVTTAASLGVGSLAVAAAGKLGYPAVLGAVVTFLALGALAVAVLFQEARPAVRGMEGAR